MRTSLSILFVAAAVTADAEIVDRLAAIVDRDVITLSELERAQKLQQLKGEAVLPLQEVLERLIESRLVSREVARYPDPPVTDEETRRALDLVKRAFGSDQALEKALAQFGMTEVELKSQLASEIAVTRYVERRFRVLVQVADEDVHRYYDAELVPELQRAGKTVPRLESIQGDLRRILEEKQFNEKVAEWIDQLKGAAKVRRHVW